MLFCILRSISLFCQHDDKLGLQITVAAPQTRLNHDVITLLLTRNPTKLQKTNPIKIHAQGEITRNGHNVYMCHQFSIQTRYDGTRRSYVTYSDTTSTQDIAHQIAGVLHLKCRQMYYLLIQTSPQTNRRVQTARMKAKHDHLPLAHFLKDPLSHWVIV